MMRGGVEPLGQAGRFSVPVPYYPNAVRPNRLAAGMTRNNSRQTSKRDVVRHKMGQGARLRRNDAALALMTRGTTDRLASGLQFMIKRAPCPTCGGKAAGRHVLSDMGRQRLERARKRAERRAKESPLVGLIAKEFGRVLNSWLTDAEMREVIRLNDARGQLCASHDFCDANMAILEAFETVTGRAWFGGGSTFDTTLFNEAWPIAASFYFGKEI